MRWARVAMAMLVLMSMLTMVASPALAQEGNEDSDNEAAGGGDYCSSGEGNRTLSFEQALRDYEFICAFVAPFLNNMSLLILGLITYGAIGTASFIRTGSPMIPYVMLLMVGGAIASQIAGPGIALITIVVLSIIGGIPVIAYRYYRRV
jgi:hypothetical protein